MNIFQIGSENEDVENREDEHGMQQQGKCKEKYLNFTNIYNTIQLYCL